MIEAKAIVPNLPPAPPNSGVLKTNRIPVNKPATSIYQKWGHRFLLDMPVKLAQITTIASCPPIWGNRTGKTNPPTKPTAPEARTGPLPK